MAGEQTTSEPLRDGEIIAAAADAGGIEDAAAKKAATQEFLKGKTDIIRANRDSLQALAGRISGTAPQTEKEKISRILIIGDRAAALEAFKRAILAGKHDFMGDDSGEAETEANPIFKDTLLPTMLAEVFSRDTNETLLSKFRDAYKEWMGEASKFMVQQVADWKGLFTTRMEASDVQTAINKIWDRAQGGQGTFEEWLTAHEKYGPLYKGWKQSMEALDSKRGILRDKLGKAKASPDLKDFVGFAGVKAVMDGIEKQITEADDSKKLDPLVDQIEQELPALGKAIKPLYEKVAEVEGKLNAYSGLAPKALEPVQALKKKIEDAQKIADLPTTEQITALEGQIATLEQLKGLAENAEIPKEKKDPILADVKEGKKAPEAAVAELEQLRQGAQAAIARTEGEDAPAVDKLVAYAERLKSGKTKIWGVEISPKSALLALAGALTGLFTALAKLPLIGNWVRKNFLSNKVLAEQGDERAKALIPVENAFHKFGLPRSIAIDSADQKTCDVVAAFSTEPEKTSKKADVQAKLRQLAAALKEKGGDTSDVPLVEFLNANPIGEPVQSPAALQPAAASPEAAVATGAAVAGGAATVVAGTATAAATASPPEARESALPSLCAIDMDNSLNDYRGKGPIKLSEQPVNFQYVYPKSTEPLETEKVSVACSILPGNKFKIGDYTYNVKLPGGADLESVKIEGFISANRTAQGTATLTAKMLFVTKSGEIPLSDLVTHLEALSKGPQSHPVTVGDNTVTFERA